MRSIKVEPEAIELHVSMAVAAERERCAKIAEAYRWDEIHNECCEGNMGWLLGKVADAIRVDKP